MPKNLESIVRYRVINSCLRSKYRTYPSKQELMDACSEALGVNAISSRTLEKDLYDMRSNESLGFFAPIKYSSKHNGYFYEDDNYSIDNVPLNKDDIEVISFASAVLSQFKHVELLNGLQGAVDKLQEALAYRNPELEGLEVLQFDVQEYARGGEFLGDIYRYITEKEVVELLYKKFDTIAPKQYEFHPYFLKEFQGAWYVVGFVAGYNALRTFALDRIVSMEPIGEYEEVSEKFDRKSFYEHVYGIHQLGGVVETIKVRLTTIQAEYLKVTPLHPSQQIVEEQEDSSVVVWELVPNRELLMKFLSFGSGVEVLEPESLRQQLKEELLAAANKY